MEEPSEVSRNRRLANLYADELSKRILRFKNNEQTIIMKANIRNKLTIRLDSDTPFNDREKSKFDRYLNYGRRGNNYSFDFRIKKLSIDVNLVDVDLNTFIYRMLMDGWVLVTKLEKFVESCLECGNEAKVRCSESGDPFCNQKCYSKYNE
jgi:hypothetical protein